MKNKSVFFPHGREITWIDPQALAQKETCEAFTLWTTLRGERRWPARKEMTLRQMAGLLPYMSLVKVLGDGIDFEHRIVGDAIVQAFNVPIQNRRFSEIAKEAPMLIESSFALFRQVAATGVPIAWRQRVGHNGMHIVFTDAEMVLLPFGDGGDAVDHIAAFGVYSSQTFPSN